MSRVIQVITSISIDETGTKCEGCPHLGSYTSSRHCGLFGDKIVETPVMTGLPFPNAYRTEYARTSRCIAAQDAAGGARRDGIVEGLRRANGIALAMDEDGETMSTRRAIVSAIDSIVNGGAS